MSPVLVEFRDKIRKVSTVKETLKKKKERVITGDDNNWKIRRVT